VQDSCHATVLTVRNWLLFVYRFVSVTGPLATSVLIKILCGALEGLAAVVNRVTCSAPVPGSTLYVYACHPRGALPAPGLAGCPVGRGE
jgi:hypothetical protein